jgi:hypothetical protein
MSPLIEKRAKTIQRIRIYSKKLNNRSILNLTIQELLLILSTMALRGKAAKKKKALFHLLK